MNVSWVDFGLSTERLGEMPLREVRRRLRAEEPSSSKGFGRVEQGSEDTARSFDSDGDSVERSIWEEPTGTLTEVDWSSYGNAAMVSEAQRSGPLCSVISGFSMCGLQLLKAVVEIWQLIRVGNEKGRIVE